MELLKRLGADHVINYKEDDQWGVTARNFTPDKRGVDHVLQAGGPGTMPQSLEAVRLEGIIHVIGAINYLDQTEPPDSVTTTDLIVHMCIVRGFVVGSRRQMEDMARFVEANDIHPIIDKRVFAFKEAKEGFEYLRQQRHIGKVVVTVD
ncbi:Zinc-type alcohol dehydrogenase-like protein [Fusarium oxysporum f. sp. raphani]|nr:Zinc-type alcohol dehydrogenase-like protein [Fusarium oxysporum f. sp. raphani]